MWYAGIGIDFTLPVAENQFHIQPSIDYYGLAIQSVGELERSSSGSFLDDFVEQANAVGNAKVFHGISPTLALSVDVFEEGPWRWSMFMQGRAVFLLNDPRVTSSSVLDANSVVFKAGIDDLILQVQGGFQVQWTGLK